jgi:hypothetical protein
MAPVDEEDDGFILVPYSDYPIDRREPQFLNAISQAVDSLLEEFWPVNKKIHDNPERGFKEFIAHDVLTKFMKSQSGWAVTPSAYGMETAWVAVFDTGRRGPVVSFNAEMGKFLRRTLPWRCIETNFLGDRLSSQYWPFLWP